MKNQTKFKFNMLVVALAVSTSSAPAFALDSMDEANQTAYITSFKALDTDNSETLTKTEASKKNFLLSIFQLLMPTVTAQLISKNILITS